MYGRPYPEGWGKEPPAPTWRDRFAAPAVSFIRTWLRRLRNFADFWFCEMDKVGGS